ncbi:hypothetical protein A8806_11735 [Faecalicatena orotica]|uniref:Uncharacterized protein n=1 Tax=Faecalicatena orotica TaxID=1544 RepID=A0A2Y9CAP0_9FIRM|nr:hypothetical protein A8806_11735 [Faecalicatena orotica]SSA58138.1 hypothetical protein SAMN05216536_11735 [Faecalicatena orotica]
MYHGEMKVDFTEASEYWSEIIDAILGQRG